MTQSDATRLLALCTALVIVMLWRRHMAAVRRWAEREEEPDLSQGVRDPWLDGRWLDGLYDRSETRTWEFRPNAGAQYTMWRETR